MGNCNDCNVLAWFPVQPFERIATLHCFSSYIGQYSRWYFSSQIFRKAFRRINRSDKMSWALTANSYNNVRAWELISLYMVIP